MVEARLSRKQSSRRRRHQILDAALRCFLQHGVDATTIEQIRSTSGASLGSIYHHFQNKEDIALAVYAEAIEGYHDQVLASLRAHHAAREGIVAMVCAHLDWVTSNPARSLYLTRVEMADASGPGAARIAEILRRFFEAVEAWFEPLVERGEIVRVDPGLYVPLALGPTASFARHWLAHRLDLQLDHVAETLGDAAWKALKT